MIGGTVFVHNAISQDYCILESVESLLFCCDKVLVLDASSTDGTLELLQKNFKNRCHIASGATWDTKEDFSKLARLANEARVELLRREPMTKMHFMLQADEVIHESSKKPIQIVQGHVTMVRRLNFWGNPDYIIPLHSPRKPCSDTVIRYAFPDCPAVGDAESLEGNVTCDATNSIVIFHYGFIRDPKKHVDKIINMQTWFHGEGGPVDEKVLGMKGKDFDPYVFYKKEELTPYKGNHPSFARLWLEERYPDVQA